MICCRLSSLNHVNHNRTTSLTRELQIRLKDRIDLSSFEALFEGNLTHKARLEFAIPKLELVFDLFQYVRL